MRLPFNFGDRDTHNTPSPERESLRSEIEQLTADFLAAGNTIDRCEGSRKSKGKKANED